MEKITFCIPTKNNLRYLKGCLKSIKQNSTQTHDVIIYIDGDTDGTEDWLISQDIRYLKNDTDTPKGIATGYNRCIEAAETEIVCMFHADMYMAKDFDTNILKHLTPRNVISATRIEPPLHPPGLEKIVQNFGMYPEDFMLQQFNDFVEKIKKQEKDKTTRGIFAPWVAYKKELLDIRMHDESFHSYHEDSDVFNRMLLNGMQFVQSRDALVYHLTCRGGQFQDGVEEVTRDKSFHIMKERAMKHYIRKWGTWIQNDEYQHPIIFPKYNIGIVLNKANLELVRLLEPWCDKLYIDDQTNTVFSAYYQEEHKNTAYNLKTKILKLPYTPDTEILVEVDKNTFTQEDFISIQQLPQILQTQGEIGTFKVGNLTVIIKALNEYQNSLIAV